MASDLFGNSVACAGDINGDGFGDLVVGGASFVHSRGTASILGSLTGTAAIPQRILEGAATSDSFGWSVAGAGDVNGDGYADLVIGAVGARWGQGQRVFFWAP